MRISTSAIERYPAGFARWTWTSGYGSVVITKMAQVFPNYGDRVMPDSPHGRAARIFGILTLSSIFWVFLIPLAASAEGGATSHKPKSAPAVAPPVPTQTTKPPDPAISSRDAWRATMTRPPSKAGVLYRYLSECGLAGSSMHDRPTASVPASWQTNSAGAPCPKCQFGLSGLSNCGRYRG